MTDKYGQQFLDGAANRRQALEQILEDTAIGYLELRRTTGLTESILDEALPELEQLGISTPKSLPMKSFTRKPWPRRSKNGIPWMTPRSTCLFRSAQSAS